MKLDLTNYPNIEKVTTLSKIDHNLWYVSGEKNGYNTSAMGRSKKEALETLELHLSYVLDKK